MMESKAARKEAIQKFKERNPGLAPSFARMHKAGALCHYATW
jgi:hypothetical protein